MATCMYCTCIYVFSNVTRQGGPVVALVYPAKWSLACNCTALRTRMHTMYVRTFVLTYVCMTWYMRTLIPCKLHGLFRFS